MPCFMNAVYVVPVSSAQDALDKLAVMRAYNEGRVGAARGDAFSDVCLVRARRAPRAALPNDADALRPRARARRPRRRASTPTR